MGPTNSAPILDAAEHWRRQALELNGSVFSSSPIWTQEHIESLITHFVENLDLGEGNFSEKLERQLATAEPEAKQLAAEMMWVMLLCPSNTLAPRKRKQIEEIWNWSGMRLSPDSRLLTDAVLDGVGSAGTAYNTNRWRELVYMIRFARAWKALNLEDRRRLLGDGWAFAEWLADIPESNTRQLRHMLLFLLFPDDFERIFGGTDRRSIVTAFTQKSSSEVQKLDPIAIDRELQRIRQEAAAKYLDQELDFYNEPLKSEWVATGLAGIDKITREHVIAAIKEIDVEGVPEDAQSTGYDLIQEGKHYPPKYVVSLAAKYARGIRLSAIRLDSVINLEDTASACVP